MNKLGVMYSWDERMALLNLISSARLTKFVDASLRN
jgi:hypothetical protein